MAEETRTEYLARITAEYPGAYHRIDDLMRDWDNQHGYYPGAADVKRDEAPSPEPDPDNAIAEGDDSPAEKESPAEEQP